MYYEYAVDPASFDSWQTTRYLLDAFGFDKGRLICEFPRGWKAEVYKQLPSTLREIERERIVERLKLLPREILMRRPGVAFNATNPWLKNALAEHTRCAFKAVLSPGKGAETDDVLDPREVDATNARWSVPPAETLPREVSTVVARLRPLLQQASAIRVVDPYFHPKGALKVQFLHAIVRATAPNAAIEVYLKEGVSGEPAQSLCAMVNARLPEQIPAGRSVEIVVWRERPGGERFHNRFLLTNVGGVQFGDGLEQGVGQQVDRVSRLGDRECEEYLRRYGTSSTAFEFVCRTTVRGTRRV
jgi:hypothetical protein